MARIRTQIRLVAFVFVAFLGFSTDSFTREAEVVLNPAIASAHPLATQAGYEVMRRGGNAFDAAIAVSATLAVVEPFSSGIGGGGFFLLHRASDGKDVMLDAREVAPARANANLFLDNSGTRISESSLNGARAAAIPGLPAALDWLAKKYGVLILKDTLAPAIRLAREGFMADERYLCMVRDQFERLKNNEESARVFLDHGRRPQQGFRIRQPRLAHTLDAIAAAGRRGFYDGRVGGELLSTVDAAGGIWIKEDLLNYEVVEREPIRFEYRSAKITTAALPSSGGIVLAESLNILEGLPLDTLERDHYIVEAMRRAYQDRARYLGDSDFVRVPVTKLLSKTYAVERAQTISMDRATRSSDAELLSGHGEGRETTHFSIVDRHGNRVAATLSINTSFGSGLIAGKTGVLLNNHMDDFAIVVDTPNVYGLVGTAANAIAPHKRPLSSMSPTFVEDNKGILILGTPGGSRIISMVLLGILDYVENSSLNAEKIVSKPRFHHQYLPDALEIEPIGFDTEWVRGMKDKGHNILVAKRRWGNMQAITIDRVSKLAHMANDPRGKSCD